MTVAHVGQRVHVSLLGNGRVKEMRGRLSVAGRGIMRVLSWIAFVMRLVIAGKRGCLALRSEVDWDAAACEIAYGISLLYGSSEWGKASDNVGVYFPGSGCHVGDSQHEQG